MLRGLAAALGGPSAASAARAHRPILRRDVERMRRCVDGAFVMPPDNPGCRVEPEFLDEAAAEQLRSALRTCTDQFGYPYDGDARAHTLSASGDVEQTFDGVVNNVRVTGRLERPDVQRLPPWGYGDELRREALPPALDALASRIQSCGAFAVGPLRDVTINARSKSFFQLDPHVDPAADGPDVFILGLESSVVLTFTPPDELLEARGLPPRRREPQAVGTSSWSDLDIDVLVQPRSLVHFTADARSSWMHAIRAGVSVDAAAVGGGGGDGAPIVCDWWGQPDYLLQRAPSRLSVVMAFGPS